LVLTRNQILQFNTEREDAALNATSQRLNLITTELQEGVMKTRMQPIGVVWNKFPRVVRTWLSPGKKTSSYKWMGPKRNSTGQSLRPSKTAGAPVRNSCDHGIELPEVRLSAGKPPREY